RGARGASGGGLHSKGEVSDVGVSGVIGVSGVFILSLKLCCKPEPVAEAEAELEPPRGRVAIEGYIVDNEGCAIEPGDTLSSDSLRLLRGCDEDGEEGRDRDGSGGNSLSRLSVEVFNFFNTCPLDESLRGGGIGVDMTVTAVMGVSIVPGVSAVSTGLVSRG
ncbi:hypothetical protein HK102_012403, partial [Quaeritorhiza haematococci]